MGNIHPLSRIINNFADLNTFEFTSIIIIIHTYGNSDYFLCIFAMRYIFKLAK